MDALGVFSGQFRVTESGASSYNVPLKLAPGTAGVTPEVSLGYSSQGGDGLLGLGWSLNAGGNISRCRQTLLIDKVAKPITWGKDDRFCLNGQRLLLVTPNAQYGDNNTDYKTEIDSFVTVTMYTLDGTNSTAPNYFKVWAKDGSISTYGTSAVGAVNVPSELGPYPSDNRLVMSWMLTKFEDSAGNKIIYNYEQTPNHQLLTSIDYAFAGSQSNASVKFSYKTRNAIKSNASPQESMSAGYKFVNDSMLDAVTVFNAGQAIRTYQLYYNNATTQSYNDNISRLTELYECDGEGAVCLPPLRFEWGAKQTHNITTATPQRRLNLKSGGSYSFAPSYFDVNGDGRMDMAWLQKADNGNYQMMFAVQKTDGYFAEGRFKDSGYTRSFENSARDQENVEPNKRRVRLYPFDYNGDGRSDLAVYTENLDPNQVHRTGCAGRWILYLATPTATQDPAKAWELAKTTIFLPFCSGEVQYGDLDSDGLADAYSIVSDRIKVSLRKKGLPFDQPAVDAGSANGAKAEHLFPGGDFNGDGRLDFVGYKDNSTWEPDAKTKICAQLDFALFTLQQSTLNGTTLFAGDTLNGAKIIDATKAPLSLAADTKVTSKFGSDVRELCSKLKVNADYKNLQFADLNGDGALDAIWGAAPTDIHTFTEIKYSLGHGDGEFDPAISNTVTESTSFQVLDFDGNGKLDIVIQPKTGGLSMATWTSSNWYFTKILTDEDITTNQLMDLDGNGVIDRVRTYNKTVPSGIGGNGTTNIDAFETALGGLKTTSTGKPDHSIGSNLVTAIISGQGMRTQINYEPLNQTAHYAPNELRQVAASGWVDLGEHSTPYGTVNAGYWSTAATVDPTAFNQAVNDPFSDLAGKFTLGLDKNAPVLEYSGPVPVVTLVSSSAPTKADPNAQASVSYNYAQAKMQAGGRGLLGFKSLTSVDLQRKITTTTSYRQDWPFIGSPMSTKVYTEDGKTLSESSNDYAIYGITSDNVKDRSTQAATYGSQALGPIQVYTQKSVETSFNFYSNIEHQEATGERLSEVITTTRPDAYGNVTCLQVVTNDDQSFGALPATNCAGLPAAGANSLAVKTTTNTYAANTGTNPSTQWQALGRLLTTQVSSDRRDTPSKTLNSKFGYFAVNDNAVSCASSSYAPPGLLCAEQVDPPSSAEPTATTRHYYDQWGNKVFSASAADGKMRLSPLTVMDSTGRFPQASYAVFSSRDANPSPVSDYNSLAACRTKNSNPASAPSSIKFSAKT